MFILFEFSFMHDRPKLPVCVYSESNMEKWKFQSIMHYESEVAQSCPTLYDPTDCSLPGSIHPWDFPGKSTGVGCHFLLQRIFLTQGLNQGCLHCKWILYHLSHQGRPFFFGKYINWTILDKWGQWETLEIMENLEYYNFRVNTVVTLPLGRIWE